MNGLRSGNRHSAGLTIQPKDRRRGKTRCLSLGWCLLDAEELEEGDGAADEVAELAALEEAVAEEGEVNHLLDHWLAGGVGCDDAFLLFA